MHQLLSQNIHCPYCGEMIEIVIDSSISEQEYIEDCEVCCRPINLSISIDMDENIRVTPKHENEI